MRISRSGRVQAPAGKVRRCFRSTTLAVAVVAAGLASAMGSPPAGAQSEPACKTPESSGDAIATSAALLAATRYSIRTVYRSPSGQEVKKEIPAVLAVPALVNVDAGSLSPPDITVELLPLAPDHVVMKVARLPLAPASLPLRVALVVDVPGGPTQVVFGYDSRAANAPGLFGADFRFTFGEKFKDEGAPPGTRPSGSRSRLTLDISVTAPGRSLELFGEVFAVGSVGARVDPKTASVLLEPVPRSLTLGAVLSCKDQVSSVEAEVRSSEPTTATARATDVRGSKERTLDATIATLPRSVRVTYRDDRLTHDQQVSYSASERIGSVTALAREKDGGVTRQEIEAAAKGLPLEFTANLTKLAVNRAALSALERRTLSYEASEPVEWLRVRADDTSPGNDEQVVAELHRIPRRFTLVAERRGTDDPATEQEERTTRMAFDTEGQPLGSIEAGVATDRDVAFLDPVPFFESGELTGTAQPGYAFADGDDAGLRVREVASALIDTADPLTVRATSAGGPFLLLRQGTGADIEARVVDLPSQVDLSYSPTSQVVTYAGDATISKIHAEVTLATPVRGRVSRADVLVRELPPGITLTLSPDDPGSEVGARKLASFDAHGSQVGLVEVLLTSGPDERLPAEAGDGVLVRDVEDRFVVFGRISNLRHARVSQRVDVRPIEDAELVRDSVTLELDAPTPTGRALTVDVQREDNGQQERLFVALANRPSTIEEFTLTRDHLLMPFASEDFLPPLAHRVRWRADRAAEHLVFCRRTDDLLDRRACDSLFGQPPSELFQAVPEILQAVGTIARMAPLPRELDVCLANDPSNKSGMSDFVGELNCIGPLPRVDEPTLCNDLPHLECVNGQMVFRTSILFAASERVAIDLFDCGSAPRTTSVSDPCGGNRTTLERLQLRTMRAQIDPPKLGSHLGHLFVDSDGLDPNPRPVSGEFSLISRGADVHIELPDLPVDRDEFSARHRLVIIQAQVSGLNGTLDVLAESGDDPQCPPGMEVEVEIEFLGIEFHRLANELCVGRRA